MSIKRTALKLYAITDRQWLNGAKLSEHVKLALEGGATMIQIRDKNVQKKSEALEIKRLCHEHNAPLIINDNVQLAIDIDADGVHLGQDDMDPVQARKLLGPDKIIGVTAKTVEQAKRAQAQGADYLGSGAVFGSTTKLDAKPMSKELLKEITSSVEIPVVAIGGINEDNAATLAGTHIAGIAVVGAIFASSDIRAAAQRLGRICDELVKHTALTIAGSDSSGGAGIQADLKTMLANGVFGESVITALTAQNTMGVDAVMNVPPDFIEAQMKAVFTDIFPEAVKIGMTSSVETIEVIAAGLKKYKASNIVLDPVMVATSGSRLLEENAAQTLMDRLFPMADMITPNIPELEVISGIAVRSKADIIEASKAVYDKYGCPVLSKGGHFTDTEEVCDYLWDGKVITEFETKRVDNPNSHGTGCTLSSAIASNLAKGCSLTEAVEKGKKYVTDCLKAMLDLGHGSGPMNHGAVFLNR